VLKFVESRNQGDKDKKTSLDCISQRNPLSPAQGKVAQVMIMLKPLSFDKDERVAKRRFLTCLSSEVFYFFLEYR
jgi:hypothetical protein